MSSRGWQRGEGVSVAPGPCPMGKDPPCHLWWPSLLVLVLVDGPHGSLDILHTHKALVQAQVVADGVLQAEQAGELSGTVLIPLPRPLLFITILLLTQPLWLPMSLGCPVCSPTLCRAMQGHGQCSPHQQQEGWEPSPQTTCGTQPCLMDLGQMLRKMKTV